MTEAEWLECTDPQEMLDFLRGKISGRKLSLFAVACCRRSYLLKRDRRGRQAIEWTERLIEGLACNDDPDAPSDGDCYLMAAAANHCMTIAARAGAGNIEEANQYARWVIDRCSESAQNEGAVLRRFAALLRCMIGNPFHPAAPDNAWLAWQGGTIPKMAQIIYKERQLPSGQLDNTRLAVLADALEEAGCTDPENLGHLRGPGPHYRGCHIVDLLLGKG